MPTLMSATLFMFVFFFILTQSSKRRVSKYNNITVIILKIFGDCDLNNYLKAHLPIKEITPFPYFLLFL